MTRKKFRLTLPPSPTTPAPVSSKPKGEKQPKEKVIDTSKEVRKDRSQKKRGTPEEKKGSPRKHKQLPQDPYDIFKDGNTFD